MSHRGPAILLVLGVLAAASGFATALYGFTVYRDFWDVSAFVSLFYGGAAGAIAATAAAWRLRRIRSAGTGPRWTAPFETLAHAGIALYLVSFLLMQSGSFRAAWHVVGRHLVLQGMARDLPPPPPQTPVR